MTQKVDIWMPLYIADYLADTSRLTTEQHGAYLLLLIDYWRNGSLPDSDAILAQITRLSPDAWSNARSILQAYFKHEGGMWVHGRVEDELLKAKESREKAKTRASTAAKARWDATSNATSTAQAMPKDMLVQCPSPSPSEVIKTKAAPKVAKPDGVSDSLWVDFLAVRKAKHAALTETALEGIRREAANAGKSLSQTLTICCERGWAGFSAKWLENDIAKTPSGKPMTMMEEAEARKRAKEARQ